MKRVIDQLLHQWGGSLYLEPLLIGTAIISYYLICKQSKTYITKLFRFYLTSLILLFISVDIIYCINAPWSYRLKWWEIIDSVFEYIQTCVFIRFYSALINKVSFEKAMQRLIRILGIYLLFNIVVLLGSNIIAIRNFKIISWSIFLFCLTSAPIFYFYKIYRHNKILDKSIAFLSVWILGYSITSIISFGIIESFLKTEYKFLYGYATMLHYIILAGLCILLVYFPKDISEDFSSLTN